MTRRLAVLLCVGSVLLFGQQAFGAGFGTPVMDGVLDACYGSAEATDQTGDGNGNAVMDLVQLYVCNDANYWYFYFTINADIDATRWGKYAIYIDKTNDLSGATSDAWGRNVTVSDNHKPEYGLYSWVDNLPYDVADTQFWVWGGSSWSQNGSLDGVGRSYGAASALEWKVSKTKLGSPSEIWCEAWCTGGGTSDNAQDTSNDPAEDWNATDWSTTAVLLVSTHVSESTAADVDPPIVTGASSYAAPHNTILVEFNEPVDQTTAETPGNYSVNSGTVSVSSAVRNPGDYSKVTLTLGSNLTYGGSNSVLVTGVKDLALNTIVNNGVTNKACFCLSRIVFKGNMNLHLRSHSTPIDTFSLEGGVYPLTWSPTCDLFALDDGVAPDAVAGDSVYTVAVDFSRPSDCATGTDTTWIEFKFVHQCIEWEAAQHYYANPGLTCATGVDTFSVWWDDVAPENYTDKPIDVIFRVNMYYYDPQPADTVGINGGQYPLNWDVPTTTFLKDDGVYPDSMPADDIYCGRVRFPVNTWKLVEYKFLFRNGYECSLSVNRNVYLDDAVYDTVGVNPLVLPVVYYEDYCKMDVGETPTVRTLLLEQNRPNPFNPTTTFTFTLPGASRATLTVYDALGRVVKTLVDAELPAGEHRVAWDGVAADGARVASGVYFYELESEGSTKARKLVVIY
ncbi:MAG: T9SS type A sorting domain-containing protein [Candidatus Eisenbacteria bacterium]|nr:T9SS type A sorting domain-containing protein [Candidatus Eisenbacteria bacterium]